MPWVQTCFQAAGKTHSNPAVSGEGWGVTDLRNVHGLSGVNVDSFLDVHKVADRRLKNFCCASLVLVARKKDRTMRISALKSENGND
jgi:hypothetical protein